MMPAGWTAYFGLCSGANPPQARMVELVDTTDLNSVDPNGPRVQVPLRVLNGRVLKRALLFLLGFFQDGRDHMGVEQRGNVAEIFGFS